MRADNTAALAAATLNRPAFDRRFVLPAVAEEVIMVSP